MARGRKREALLVLLGGLLRQLAVTCEDLAVVVEELRSNDRCTRAQAELDVAVRSIVPPPSGANWPPPGWMQDG